MNSSNADNFQHTHLLSDDPVSATTWYEKKFGIPHLGPPASREARFNRQGLQVGPLVFLNIDGALFAWFPTGTAQGLYPADWQGALSLPPIKVASSIISLSVSRTWTKRSPA